MRAAGVPTAETMPVARPPCVIKADGLAAGKGVFVCQTPEELEAALPAVGAISGSFLVEELLEGEEASLFALTDGARVVPLAAARDFKRIGDGDVGPNTGGMGAFSPIPEVPDIDQLVDLVHRPVIEELARRGAPFIGCLYAGLMLTEDGPRVLEFNCRFGDPETQVIVPLVEGDLLTALEAAARGDLSHAELTAAGEAAVTVVLAGPDYPTRSDYSGVPIDGIDDAEASGALVFHAGTALRGDRLVTNGGRILNVTAVGATLAEARERAYAACAFISFPGMRYRRDIALERGIRVVR
jgi:phosphoribosylamine--glycine ligase